MRRLSSYAGAMLRGNIILIVLGVILRSLPGVTATGWNDYIGSISSIDHGSSSCNFTTLFSTRSKWSGEGEPCNQKLPFEFWIYMKAEGSAGDPEADHVRNECLLPRSIGMVELITPEDWDSTTMDAAPGQLLRETKRAACYRVQSPLDFEAMCTDDQVTKVSRITAVSDKTRGSQTKKSERRLQETMSVARIAHGVDALISGLEELGCQRTTGEDQNLCIMSDSLNRLGGLAALQESGDLPPDEFLTIVEEIPEDDDSEPTDEGSAMMELAYDIASGANFKFNTFGEGSIAAADDIIKLASDEACDVMVDDVGFRDQPGFRDGNVSEAVNEVVADGILYFSSAGNSGNGFKFTSNWECASDLFEDETHEPCDSGVASHVFNPDATGIERYGLLLSGAPFLANDIFLLHWDDDEGTSRKITVELWTVDVSGTEATFFDRDEFVSDIGTAVVVFGRVGDLPVEYFYFITISQEYTGLEDVEMRLLSRPDDIFSNFSDGSIYGHKCATSIISVAAMNSAEASGVGDRFTDPEPSSVELFSSRGPCYVDSGNGLEERLQPVTTAANYLETSTVGFEFFSGTSAAAPVAAAIATIVRAACYPREVTFSDMKEMLTDYTYTIDVTSDADGEEETWGVEAGYGIISADQMLGWITANCQESCPGAATPSPSVPTPAPSTTPTREPPTTPPVSPPTVPPTSSPIVPPTTSPAAPPTSPPTTPPITPPTKLPVAPLISPPTMPPTMPPLASSTASPTSPPIVPPTTPPGAPPTKTPTTPPIAMPPIAPPTVPPMPTTLSPTGGLMDASERTLVTVTANAFDTRTTGFGCPPNGCVAANTRDGDLSTRWSCKEDLLGGTNCEITYTFEEPQDIVRVLVAFYKGDERTRVLKVKLNGSSFSVIESSGETDGFEEFEVDTDETETLTLEGLELRGEEWISITEVQFLVL